MKIAGGVLLIVFGAIGMIANFFIAGVGAVVSGAGSMAAASAQNAANAEAAGTLSSAGSAVAAYGTIVGLLAEITAVLARAEISVFALSTFDTDYVLVPGDRLDEAVERLGEAGFAPYA